MARRKTSLSRFYIISFLSALSFLCRPFPPSGFSARWEFYGSYTNAILLYVAINISFSCFLYTGFIKGIPKALDEAAFIDGASTIKVFFKVVFPLLKPISMTVLILDFMNIWNDIKYSALLFIQSEQMDNAAFRFINFSDSSAKATGIMCLPI